MRISQGAGTVIQIFRKGRNTLVQCKCEEPVEVCFRVDAAARGTTRFQCPIQNGFLSYRRQA